MNNRALRSEVSSRTIGRDLTYLSLSMETPEVTPPAPDAIRQAREDAGLSVAEAAVLVHTYDRLWRYWEAGQHRMPPAAWELFLLKVAQRAGEDA